jgi:hypothetical protein
MSLDGVVQKQDECEDSARNLARVLERGSTAFESGQPHATRDQEAAINNEPSGTQFPINRGLEKSGRSYQLF